MLSSCRSLVIQAKGCAVSRRTLQERLESKMIPEPNSGCWLWLGGTNIVTCGRREPEHRPVIWFKGKHEYANRISFLAYKGSIPEGRLILHSCDNSLCVNPDHLYAGTHQDNSNDMIQRKRNHWQKQTHCKYGHPFEGQNLIVYTQQTEQGPRFKRFCRACLKRSNAIYYAENKKKGRSK